LLLSVNVSRLLFLFFTLFFSGIFGMTQAWASEAALLEWETFLGGKEADRGFFAQQTDDGGFIVVGETSSYYMYGNGDNDVLVARLDSSGKLQWRRALGGVKKDSGVFVQQTSDGGYIITGATQSYRQGEDNDIYLLKIDGSGRLQWQKSFGGLGDDYGACVKQTSDGGFIITGKTSSSGAGDFDLYLIKTDPSGKKEWEKTFGGKETDLGMFVIETLDGGYVVVGQTFSPFSGGFDIYLVKTGADGKKEWEKSYGGKGWEIAESLAQTCDGGYIITGQTSSFSDGSFDTYLLKIDATGTQEWEKTFANNGWSTGKYVMETSDCGYLVAGWIDSGSINLVQAHIFKTDANGSIIRELKYEKNKFNRDFFIYPVRDGGYIITGWWAEPLRNNEYRNNGIQVYLAKLKAL
jgi:hypothetical protein